jgi:hypothetical protein
MTDECPKVGPKGPTWSRWSWHMAPGYSYNECYFDYSSGKKLRYNLVMIGHLHKYMYDKVDIEDIIIAKLGNGKPQFHGIYSSSSSISSDETNEERAKRLAQEETDKERYKNEQTFVLPAFTKGIANEDKKMKPKEEERKTKGTMGTLQNFNVKRNNWGNLVQKMYPIKNSRLVGVRGDGIGSTFGPYADYTQPVFWTDSIDGQEGGSFWAMEDDVMKLRAGARPWINVTPFLNKDGNPYIGDEKGRPEKEYGEGMVQIGDPSKTVKIENRTDSYLYYNVPCKREGEDYYSRERDGNNFCGAYLFKWAPNVGDSAHRTAKQHGLISDETNSKKKGGKKRTNKRKMNKIRKTRRNNKNKRKTVKKLKN